MDSERKHILHDNLRPLLFKFSAPAIMGLVVSALYNIVDTIFIGNSVGPLGIAALSIVMPVQIIMMAIGFMVGTGASSIISRSLGANNKENAISTFSNAVIINLVINIVLMIPLFLFIDRFLHFFGASVEVLPYSRDYMGIILFGFIFLSFSIAANNMIRAEGRPRAAMYPMIIGAVINIVLDAILILALNMGVKGAAIATISSQAISCIYILAYLGYSKSIYWKGLRVIHIRLKLIAEILKIGFPSFIMAVVDSIIYLVFNRAIIYYGSDMYLAVMGIGIRLIDFTIMPIIGITQGFSTIVSFNYGAKLYERVKKILWEAMAWTTLISTVVMIIMIAFTEQLLRIFTNDAALINMGIFPVRVIVILFFTLGIQVVGGSFFQAIGKALPAVIINGLRQVLFLIPLVLILPIFYGLEGIWYAIPASDLLSTIVTAFFLLFELRRIRVMEAAIA